MKYDLSLLIYDNDGLVERVKETHHIQSQNIHDFLQQVRLLMQQFQERGKKKQDHPHHKHWRLT